MLSKITIRDLGGHTYRIKYSGDMTRADIMKEIGDKTDEYLWISNLCMKKEHICSVKVIENIWG